QFAAARQAQSARDGRASRLLVFCGGADATGETLKALVAIGRLDRADLAVDVVIGQANPHRAAIEAACRDQTGTTLYCQVEDMAARMAAADLFVGAGGTSSWERCCLGLPAVVWAVADNQVAQSEALARAGAQLYLGPAREVTAERLAVLIDEVLRQPALLVHLAGQAQALVDGQGAARVASHLLATALQLRRAGPADSASIYAWRNHPDSRRHAFDPTEIDRASHERWFAAVLADPNRELLVAEQDDRPVGVLRYDIKAGLAAVSVYLVPGLAGQGWGKRLLLAGEGWLREMRPEVQTCEAEIAAGNAVSLAVFRATGFMPYRSVLRKELHDQR
ncbi:MAG: GNAT family N-acetyltransferase, partial [Hydrogenophilaceae bacterium]